MQVCGTGWAELPSQGQSGAAPAGRGGCKWVAWDGMTAENQYLAVLGTNGHLKYLTHIDNKGLLLDSKPTDLLRCLTFP